MTIRMDDVFSEDDFNKANPAESGGRNDQITVFGEHLVEIISVKGKQSNKVSAIYLIVEFKVHETSAPDEVSIDRTYSWLHNMTNKFFGAPGTKRFLAAACGLDPKSDEAQALGRNALEEAWSDAQPLTGQMVNVATKPKKVESGFDFTVHDWTPVIDDKEAAK